MKDFDLTRFHEAQDKYYSDALMEIKNGRKTSHWIWYVFPQIYGLGHSFMSKKYAVKSLDEAKAYIADPILRERLITISQELLAHDCPIEQIVGSPDDLKIRSSMTLFMAADNSIPVFAQVLEKFYGVVPDKKTLAILSSVTTEKKPDRMSMKSVFTDTCQMIECSPRLKNMTDISRKNQQLYRSGEDIPLPENPMFPDDISVCANRTFQEAVDLHKKFPDAKIAVLNFASATHPGGGVVNGARAQEESLCRCSNLYQCLNTPELIRDYYQFHRERHDCLYTDRLIYTPGIAIIKTDTSQPERLPEDMWTMVDVITCAAPNLGGYRGTIGSEDLYHIHLSRGRKILSAAAANGAEVLVLGAFGCGAFGNDPFIVSKAYSELLSEFSGYFRHVSFAVFCSNTESSNYVAFEEEFN